MKHKAGYLFILFLFSYIILAATGCSDSGPKILNVSPCMVFDFSNDESNPQTRLSVFVQLEGDVRLIEGITLENPGTGYEWDCNDGIMLSNSSNKNWYGNMNFLPPAGEKIPTGRYIVYAWDYAGNEAIGNFSLTYRDEYLDSIASDYPDLIRNSKTVNYAVYNEENVLIYYGEKIDGWNNDEDILFLMDDAFMYKKCYLVNGGSLLFVMPPVYLRNNDFNEEN